ncbi:hypothetical protein CR513_42659, partial [Mucuna pruriens]
MVSMFIDTLPSPFYEIVVGSVSSSFAELVVIGERVEVGLKRGKFTQAIGNVGFARKTIQEKRKGEPNMVISEVALGPSIVGTNPTTPLYVPYQSEGRSTNTTGSNVDINAKPTSSWRNNPRILDPVPVPYSELLKTLIEKRLIVIVLLKLVEPLLQKL